MNRAQPISRDHQVRRGEQAEQLRGVLCQPLVAHLAMTSQVLDDMKWMLDPRADLCLGLLERDHEIAQKALAPGRALLARAFGFRKAHLPFPRRGLVA